MKLRLSTLTPFLLGALVRGQITRDAPLSSKDLAAIPRPDAQLQMVPCEGALKEAFDSFLLDFPEKQYQEAEYAERCSYFHYSLQYVTIKDADANKGFDVALNEYADFSPKELANLGGALPVVTNPKPAPVMTLGATDPLPTSGNNAGATAPAADVTATGTETSETTTTTTPETKETSPIPPAQDSIAATADGQSTTTGPISTENAPLTDADANAGARRRQARKDRRMERRRAARRRDLEEEEPSSSEGTGDATTDTLKDEAAAAATTTTTTTTGAVVETATEVVDATMTATEEAATEAAAALWDLSAFVGEAAEALAAEAPALDIDALRTAPAAPDGTTTTEEESFTTMALGDKAAAAPQPVAVDRHGVNPPATIAAVTRLAAPLPETLDYSTENNPYAVEAMGNVKDTGKCGASWALTAAALAESRLALDSGEAPIDDLSAQELLDCTDPAFGCAGGRIERALTYISNNGLAYESEAEMDSAWVGTETGMCKIDPEGEREYLGVVSQINPCNQRDLMRALVYLGPVAAHVKSSCRAFLFYAGGILDDEECFAMPFAKPSTCAAAVDHNVLIVGYDSDVDTGVDYWIVKGNYGEGWGEDGYAKIKMATRGLCGNGCLAAFPLTVVPRSFGIDAQGVPAYDGSAPSILSVYAEEATAAEAAEGTGAVAPVDPSTILPGPLPNQKGSGLPPSPAPAHNAPPATTDPVAAPPAPEGAKANASSGEEEAAKKRRRVVGGAVGGAFAGVFVLVAAFAAVKQLQKRREEMMSEVPERPHLDVL